MIEYSLNLVVEWSTQFFDIGLFTSYLWRRYSGKFCLQPLNFIQTYNVGFLFGPFV